MSPIELAVLMRAGDLTVMRANRKHSSGYRPYEIARGQRYSESEVILAARNLSNAGSIWNGSIPKFWGDGRVENVPVYLITDAGLGLYFQRKSNEYGGLGDADFEALSKNKTVLLACFRDLRLADLIGFFEFLEKSESVSRQDPLRFLERPERAKLASQIEDIAIPTIGRSNSAISDDHDGLNEVRQKLERDTTVGDVIGIAITVLTIAGSVASLASYPGYGKLIERILWILIRFGLIC